MIEVQLVDGSFKTINPTLILEIESNLKRTVVDSYSGVEYEVNDYLKGKEFTVKMVGGTTYKLSKLGLDLLRKQQQRGDFDPNMLRSTVRF